MIESVFWKGNEKRNCRVKQMIKYLNAEIAHPSATANIHDEPAGCIWKGLAKPTLDPHHTVTLNRADPTIQCSTVCACTVRSTIHSMYGVCTYRFRCSLQWMVTRQAPPKSGPLA